MIDDQKQKKKEYLFDFTFSGSSDGQKKIIYIQM